MIPLSCYLTFKLEEVEEDSLKERGGAKKIDLGQRGSGASSWTFMKGAGVSLSLSLYFF